jgi:hypothetical protein
MSVASLVYSKSGGGGVAPSLSLGGIVPLPLLLEDDPELSEDPVGDFG